MLAGQINVFISWPARAVERYTGPWNANLSQPALVIGNTIDPITPLVAAQTVVDMLGDSAVLLVRDGLGVRANPHQAST